MRTRKELLGDLNYLRREFNQTIQYLRQLELDISQVMDKLEQMERYETGHLTADQIAQMERERYF